MGSWKLVPKELLEMSQAEPLGEGALGLVRLAKLRSSNK